MTSQWCPATAHERRSIWTLNSSSRRSFQARLAGPRSS
nr:MAG TPA: hypothetical protein [Caudoviricetes sp.]